MQQAQGHIHLRFGGQRRPGDAGEVALQRRPAGAHGVRMQRVFQRRFEQTPPRRQVGDGDAQACRCGATQAIACPSRRGRALGLGVGQFGADRRRRIAMAETQPEQFDAARFEHRQQARNHWVGRDETGNAQPRGQAADTALDALDAPRQGIVGRAPAARLTGGDKLLAPALKGAVLGGMQGLRHLDAPRPLHACGLHRRQRHALAVEQLRRRAGVRRNRLLPQTAFLRPREKRAGHAGRRNLAAQQRRRGEVIEPLRRRRTLQRAPGRRAPRRLQFAVRLAQAGRQPRRDAQHRRLRPAGEVGQGYAG